MNPKTKSNNILPRCKKDVERAFGILQARWAIVQNPCRLWDMSTISDIMFDCVIMHNMLIEDEGPNNMEGFEHATTIQMHREENSQKS
jgi:hypothetical protein